MNSYERVYNRMNGLSVDRIPNLCLVMTFAAQEIGVPYGKFVTDYKLLAEGMLRCYEKYHLDTLSVCSDPMREASGFGAKVIIPEDDVPYSPVPFITEISDISKLKVSEPTTKKRMNDRIEAVGLLKSKIGKEAPVIGWVEGAFAESCDLMDISDFLCEILDEPEGAHELLEICLEQASLFAIEQLKAGADIIGIGDAASSLIGPDLYEEFALPYEQRLIQNIHQAGGRVKLHICGDLNPILPFVAKTGADIIDLDHMVDMREACRLFPETSCISGNFNPVEILLQGSSQTVESAVESCLSFSSKNCTMIAGGCEVPKFTPQENLMAVYHCLQKNSNY